MEENYQKREGRYTSESSGYTSSETGNNSYGSSSYSTHQPPTEKPSSNLVWGILCTCLCCLPFGIVSIVYATKVDSFWVAGAYQEAYAASRKARNWALWGAISSVVCSVLYVILWVLFFGGLAVLSANGNY